MPYRSEIMFHHGNTVTDTQGCILVGQDNGPDPWELRGSRAAMTSFLAHMEGQRVALLTIKGNE